MKRSKAVLTEKYKKGTYIKKEHIQKILGIISNNPEILECSRHEDDSESYVIRITLTNEQINNNLNLLQS
jgi:hypothetical protein